MMQYLVLQYYLLLTFFIIGYKSISVKLEAERLLSFPSEDHIQKLN